MKKVDSNRDQVEHNKTPESKQSEVGYTQVTNQLSES